MAGSFAAMCLIVLAAATSSGCAVREAMDGYVVDVDADTVRVEGATDPRTAPDGRPYQFRAVCLSAMHGGPVHVLSKWADDPNVARDLGKYHSDFKEKGHEWRIERRSMP